MAVRVVEYMMKDLRFSGCMSVFASCELCGTTHRFGSISMTLNGGLDAFRLSVRPIPPWVVGQSVRTLAEVFGPHCLLEQHRSNLGWNQAQRQRVRLVW